ncbi:MAG TPA: FAD-dependent oxidoreductase, partial [Stellaceae bacterium]|nr:FAD-dependent oxidoreductase [Stellaceae bacterium]
VNPRAGFESLMPQERARRPRRLAVVGGGPAGLAFAAEAAERGHLVTLYEKAPSLGGQFTLAQRIPGKEEYAESIRAFTHRLERQGVVIRLDHEATPADLVQGRFEGVVLASGVLPRWPDLPGIDHPKCVSYAELLACERPSAERIAIIGAGGIGFDAAAFLTTRIGAEEGARAAFLAEWGVDPTLENDGGLGPAAPSAPLNQVYLLQRKPARPGEGLGKSTGWIHRLRLARDGVEFITQATYRRIDDQGLHILVGETPRLLEVDRVVICAGQEARYELEAPLQEAGLEVHRIGGAARAEGLDAKRAIAEAVALAARI